MRTEEGRKAVSYVKVWSEDDCTTHDPDHESLDLAVQRITGRPFESLKNEATKGGDVHDEGDAVIYYAGPWKIVSSYPGNSSLHKDQI